MKNRNWTPLYCLIFMLVGISGFAQKDVELKSKVLDFLTYLPIENASVYIQNSTIGTISNTDGNFVLIVPPEHLQDTLVISSIGYQSFKTAIQDFDNPESIYLEEDIASLDEVVIVSDPRPTTANGIVQRAIERLSRTMPDQPYLQKGFLRHKERNKKEYKWLIESAITLYDSSFASGAKNNLKINVDETRKSYDLRDVDSLFSYSSYLRYTSGKTNVRSKKLDRDTIATQSLIDAIKWNDRRINGLDNLFFGRLNLVRNANDKGALFGESVLEKHQFALDTILVENGRKLYKIRIEGGTDYVGLNTENIFNEGFEAKGWLYIYYDNYAFKRIEYELVAASEAQRRRSKSLFDTLVNHKLIMTYIDYNGKMYPNYLYYETPKLVNVGDRSSDQHLEDGKPKTNKDEQFYYTVQEILFTKVIDDPEQVDAALDMKWSADIFSSQPYNQEFWKSYNVLLESEEEEKLIRDLTQRATLFRQ